MLIHVEYRAASIVATMILVGVCTRSNHRIATAIITIVIQVIIYTNTKLCIATGEITSVILVIVCAIADS